MKTPNTIEDEIDAIRLKNYEETKHMTPAQHAEHVKRNTADVIKQYGMKVVASAQDVEATPLAVSK
jgi:predicted DNA-binding protein (UPF0251 family)